MIKQENTYLGADGLAYCKICGEPVEAFFPPDSILGMKNILDNVHVSVKSVKQKKRHIKKENIANQWKEIENLF